MAVLGALILAYVLGSLPWSLWAGRLRGVDIREQGSGNLGATNVYRVLGWKLGLLVLLLDIAKGAAAVMFARAITREVGLVPTLAGLAAVAGHMWTPFAGFRGGKGVATGAGVFFALAPVAAGATFFVWLGVMMLGGWISVASALAAVVLPVFIVITRTSLGESFTSVFGLSLFVCWLVIMRHWSNWSRLAQGREQRIWETRAETPEGGAAPDDASRPADVEPPQEPLEPDPPSADETSSTPPEPGSEPEERREEESPAPREEPEEPPAETKTKPRRKPAKKKSKKTAAEPDAPPSGKKTSVVRRKKKTSARKAPAKKTGPEGDVS